MNWSAQALRDASQRGDYGKVVKLVREAARVSQKQLGDALDLSQSAVSRLEKRGADSYDTTQLASAAAYLQIHPHLVGLAEQTAAHAAKADPVQRRQFLTRAAGVAVFPAFPPSHVSETSEENGQPATLRLATSAFRRMDGTAPSRHLLEPVLAHLRFTQTLAAEAEHNDHRVRLAAVGSEAASLAGWLSWDMGDNGSARTWYGVSVKAARRAGHTLLASYQLGSLAQFEAHGGNGAQALSLTRKARQALGDGCPVIADAWLSNVEALAHAAIGNASACDGALSAASRAAERVGTDAPPWPWMFTFNEAKVAANRVACGAHLGLPKWVSGVQSAADAALSSGHEKQRALLLLDVATGHMALGRLDGAFSLATRALETGLRYRSGRIVERARTLRRGYSSTTPPRVVRDFDERLSDAFL